jgi:A-kinase anchor protein 10
VVCVSGIESDAVTIFTKYISPDAARPIPITEQIRNDIVGKAAICCSQPYCFS